MKSLKATAVLLAAVTIGCGDGVAESPAKATVSAQEPIGIAPPDAGGPGAGYSGAMGAEMRSIVQAALADAARRTGRGADSLEVVSAEAVTWSDGSLGCPEPGMSYTMALVPGYRIRIQAGAEVLDYHASRRGSLVLCPPERSIDPMPDRTT